MSNIFAEAINQALDADGERVTATVRPEPTYRATRVLVPHKRVRNPDLGRVHVEVYKGVQFIVREFGATALDAQPTPNHGYWTVFMTDDEFAHERLPVDKRDYEARIKTCRNAIDRALAGTVLWADAWWKRWQ